jgi:hypothetical protein
MTNKELLEKAAKAAGYKGEYQNGGEWMDIRYGFTEAFYVDDIEKYWNPLTDDGDALRLAVKLEFVIDSHGMWIRVGEPYSDALAHEQKGDDPYAATRRAIVRAAAEIGKNAN